MHLSLARIIASGIHHFRSHDFNGHPEGVDPQEWAAILLTIEEGFQLYADEEGFLHPPDDDKFMRAMALFAEYFPALWD